MIDPAIAAHDRRAAKLRKSTLTDVFAPFDPAHQPLELLRRLRAKVGIVHSAEFLADGEQRLGAQANDVVWFGGVVRHFGSGYSELITTLPPKIINAGTGPRFRFVP